MMHAVERADPLACLPSGTVVAMQDCLAFPKWGNEPCPINDWYLH